ncbi:MAG: cytosol nonspecific dipeptidase, partial [Mangrovibacterium sp.]
MNKTLGHLKPQPLWNYFESICRVPRPSKKEDRIRQFLLDFARENRLESRTDKAGNLLIRKTASPGCENRPVVILQTHLDMVCEKNSERIFNFNTDPIVPLVDGEWVRADGTTLGAD